MFGYTGVCRWHTVSILGGGWWVGYSRHTTTGVVVFDGVGIQNNEQMNTQHNRLYFNIKNRKKNKEKKNTK